MSQKSQCRLEVLKLAFWGSSSEERMKLNEQDATSSRLSSFMLIFLEHIWVCLRVCPLAQLNSPVPFSLL